MPTPYAEPGNNSSSGRAIALGALAVYGKQNPANATFVKTTSGANTVDVVPGTAATRVSSAVIQVPDGAKVIMHCSVQHDVNDPGSGGTNGLATLFARFDNGSGPVVVDSRQEDLFVMGEGIAHNVLHMTTEAGPFAAGTITFDVASSYSIASVSTIPAGKGRLTLEVVQV